MAADKPPKSGSMGVIVGFAIVTVAAAAAGGGLFYMLPETTAASPPQAASSAHTAEHGSAAPEKGQHGEHGEDVKASGDAPLIGSTLKIWSVNPLTTNLSGTKAPWIRIEGSLVYDPSIEKDMPVISSQIVEDFLAFLRTVSVRDVSGRSGFRTLLEDLNERARMRSGGKVVQYIVSTFIIE